MEPGILQRRSHSSVAQVLIKQNVAFSDWHTKPGRANGSDRSVITVNRMLPDPIFLR